LQHRTGGLAIMTEPPEMDISLDGVFKGKSPIILNDINIGNHEFTIKSSSETYCLGIEVKEGQMKNLTLRLDQLPSVVLQKISPEESLKNPDMHFSRFRQAMRP
jgi:hypothetical protein